MKRIILPLALVIFCNSITAQKNDCTVLLDSLKGSYEGDCSNGKANGTGKAKGADSYEGDFKSGFPDGQGKYTWKNGNYYTGAWKKGMKEGKGELHFRVNNRDTVTIGYWKKDVYKGEYESPYIIRNVTSEIGRVQITKIDGRTNNVTITVENLVGGGSIYSSPAQTTTTMTSFDITRGQYLSKSQNTLTNKDVNTFKGVIFPFRGTYNFGGAMIDIEIFEPGNWDITVPINK